MAPDTDSRLRSFALALFLVGAVGLLAELLLLEHLESLQQRIPLVGLSASLPAATLVLLRPSSKAVQVFRALSAAMALSGLIGIYYHLTGNIEFELEMRPTLGGLELAKEALKGATPALAPGAMAQLGLLGLLACLRHPASATKPGA